MLGLDTILFNFMLDSFLKTKVIKTKYVKYRISKHSWKYSQLGEPMQFFLALDPIRFPKRSTPGAPTAKKFANFWNSNCQNYLITVKKNP